MESIELLLQIVVDESGSASGLESDAAAWVRDDKHTTVTSMFKWRVRPCFLTVGAISAEGPGVQQAAGRLEQVGTDRSSRQLDNNTVKEQITIVSSTN